MVATVDASTKLVGQPIKRREDPRLITGAASFFDDIALTGMSHAAVLRSRYGHARINAIDVSAAEAMPGVIGVFTGKDMGDLNPLPCAWRAGNVSNNVNTPRVLAIDEVHFSGDAVAESLAQAVDALDAIQIDYQTLPTVVDARKAMAPTCELDRKVTPSPGNPMGAEGAGEAGSIASTPAVANAVIDAVSHLGITHLDMPLTPERLWRAMQA